MSDARKEAGWPVVVALMFVVVLVAMGVYVGGYFATCIQTERVDYLILSGKEWTVDYRHYHNPWQAWIFQPAAMVESAITWRKVATTVEGRPDIDSWRESTFFPRQNSQNSP